MHHINRSSNQHANKIHDSNRTYCGIDSECGIPFSGPSDLRQNAGGLPYPPSVPIAFRRIWSISSVAQAQNPTATSSQLKQIACDIIEKTNSTPLLALPLSKNYNSSQISYYNPLKEEYNEEYISLQ